MTIDLAPYVAAALYVVSLIAGTLGCTFGWVDRGNPELSPTSIWYLAVAIWFLMLAQGLQG